MTSGIIGNYVPPVGVLNPNLYKGSIAHSGIPETVKIKWRKEDGVVVEKEVGVKENMPKGFCNGDTIIFNINDNDEIILSFEVKGFKYEIDSKGNRIDFKEPSTVQEEKRCQAVEVNE